MGTATSADEFKQGLIDAFPDLGMDPAIDFVTPFLFPADPEPAQQELPATGTSATTYLALAGVTLIAGGAMVVTRSRQL